MPASSMACTAPIHVEGEPVGSCSFVAAGAMPPLALEAVTSIGRCAFDEARRIVRRGAPAKKRLRLTPREHECLVLIGRGASDLEASRSLAIAEAAVTGHIEEARRKYGVATRMELVVRALYRGELKFDELVAVEEEPAGLSLVRQVRSRGGRAGADGAPRRPLLRHHQFGAQLKLSLPAWWPASGRRRICDIPAPSPPRPAGAADRTDAR